MERYSAASLIAHTFVGLMSLGVLIIMVRYLLWPMYKKQPMAMAFAVAFAVGIMALLFIFNP